MLAETSHHLTGSTCLDFACLQRSEENALQDTAGK